MTNVLHLLRKLFVRRQQQRFLVKNGTFVVIVTPGIMGQEEQRKVHMIDISMGGAAFIYQGSSKDIDNTGFLRISPDSLETSESSTYEKVHFETVSDIPVPVCSDGEVTARRRGVRFTWMGALGEAFLKDFIRAKGICRL